MGWGSWGAALILATPVERVANGWAGNATVMPNSGQADPESFAQEQFS